VDGLRPEDERLLRELAPRVLGALLRRAGDFASAEDAVQEALLAAVAQWPAEGRPGNPGGWLYHVACRSLTDHERSEAARTARELSVARDTPTAMEELPDSADADQDTLALYFACCHPELSSSSAVALTLRAVGGLLTAEIASAYGVPEATMAQRISRAKQAIRHSATPLSLPAPAERTARLAVVMQVLYLIFNEGHTSSAGPGLMRVDLATEALRLTRALRRGEPAQPEVDGLLALMLLTDARRAARTGPLGELIPLDEQDRGLWNRAAIAEGTALVEAALARGAVGRYQLQAAIAALHGAAPSTAATDWAQILALYGVLRRLEDNPFVELNHAVATAMVHGPARGLELLEQLERDARLAGHLRLHAVRAHLLERAGDRAGALREFRSAAARADNLAERCYLQRKIEGLAASG